MTHCSRLSDFVCSALCRFVLFVVVAVSPVAVQATLFDDLIGKNDGPMPVDEAYVLTPSEISPGRYSLDWVIHEGYYLYRDKISITAAEGMVVSDLAYSESKSKQDPLFGDVEVYYSDASVGLVLTSTGDTPQRGQISVEYQGCWEGGICYPPVTKVFDVVSATGSQIASSAMGSPAAPSYGAETRQANKPVNTGSTEFSLTNQDRYIEALGSGSWPVVLGLFFVAGVALSLTPCVFPMIPILAGVIAGQQGTMTGRRGLGMALVYVLSMALTYTVAGIAAGLFGENIQVALQNPWVISVFSALFVVLAGGMFGFYPIELPRSLQNLLNNASRHQHGGEVLGVATMGFLSALIVGPCVAAPLAGALIFIGQTGDPVLGGAALFFLSIGMGLPLLLVGASAGRMLPKAGAWMNGVKAGFGVVMLLMAVWMLDRIVPPVVTMMLAGAIFVVTAIYLRALDPLPSGSGNGWRFLKGFGILLLLYGSVLLVGAASGGRSVIYPLQATLAMASESEPIDRFATITTKAQLDSQLAAARQNQQPVMLDFYADWCVSCKELETFVFADNAVLQEFERYTLVRVDVTANDDEAKAFYKRFDIVGPPALIFYDRLGEQQHERMIGVPEIDQFVAKLKQY